MLFFYAFSAIYTLKNAHGQHNTTALEPNFLENSVVNHCFTFVNLHFAFVNLHFVFVNLHFAFVKRCFVVTFSRKFDIKRLISGKNAVPLHNETNI